MIERQAEIDKVLENLNTLVAKYYIEEFKPEQDSFKFRRQHINMVNLYPAFENQIHFLLNIGRGVFQDKIEDLLCERNLEEIGRNIKYKYSSVSYKDKDTRMLIRLNYNKKFFTNYLVNEICNKSLVLKKAMLMLLKIIKDNDLDYHINGKGWLLMFLSFLIFKNYIPTIISDGSGGVDNVEAKYEAIKFFFEKFSEESKQELEEKYKDKEYKLILEFRNIESAVNKLL